MQSGNKRALARGLVRGILVGRRSSSNDLFKHETAMTDIRKTLPRRVDVKELADILGVNRGTLYDWEKKEIIPRRRRFGQHCVGWLEPDIKEWLASR
jgi:predicted DNA-binding transcriptional regulator AlpA